MISNVPLVHNLFFVCNHWKIQFVTAHNAISLIFVAAIAFVNDEYIAVLQIFPLKCYVLAQLQRKVHSLH